MEFSEDKFFTFVCLNLVVCVYVLWRSVDYEFPSETTRERVQVYTRKDSEDPTLFYLGLN